MRWTEGIASVNVLNMSHAFQATLRQAVTSVGRFNVEVFLAQDPVSNSQDIVSEQLYSWFLQDRPTKNRVLLPLNLKALVVAYG